MNYFLLVKMIVPKVPQALLFRHQQALKVPQPQLPHLLLQPPPHNLLHILNIKELKTAGSPQFNVSLKDIDALFLF